MLDNHSFANHAGGTLFNRKSVRMLENYFSQYFLLFTMSVSLLFTVSMSIIYRHNIFKFNVHYQHFLNHSLLFLGIYQINVNS